jgi:LPXTG-site transpeptidase (sortase) family protein
MRREVLAPLAVVAGLALAGLSAITWHDGSANDTPASPSDTTSVSTTPEAAPGTLQIPTLSPHETKAPPGKPRPAIRTAAPQRLDLPSIGVSAAVFPIGTQGSATLVPPADYTTVGWWSQGAEPGEGQGTTILTGHTVHTGGGALDNLGSVRIGDHVMLERTNQDLRYTVSSVTTYRKGTLAARAAQVFNQLGPERLAIVTCGDWNGEIYLSNVVVIATDPQPVDARS